METFKYMEAKTHSEKCPSFVSVSDRKLVALPAFLRGPTSSYALAQE
jgi:hypothetical protein